MYVSSSTVQQPLHIYRGGFKLFIRGNMMLLENVGRGVEVYPNPLQRKGAKITFGFIENNYDFSSEATL